NQAYQDYLANPTVLNTNYGERSMLAFEVARLSNLKYLHGIDHAMEYNYRIAEELVNSIDSVTYNKYMNDPFKELPELKHQIDNFYDLPLLEQLQLYNQPEYLEDRKSTRLNSSHVKISYAVFCLKKKKE